MIRSLPTVVLAVSAWAPIPVGPPPALPVTGTAPDLEVASIDTSGLCIGRTAALAVTVVNRGNAATDAPFDVTLTVQLPGIGPSNLRLPCEPLGPGGRNVTRFRDLVVPEAADVLLRVAVDEARRTSDSDRSNNTDASLVQVTVPCSGAPPRQAAVADPPSCPIAAPGLSGPFTDRHHVSPGVLR